VWWGACSWRVPQDRDAGNDLRPCRRDERRAPQSESRGAVGAHSRNQRLAIAWQRERERATLRLPLPYDSSVRTQQSDNITDRFVGRRPLDVPLVITQSDFRWRGTEWGRVNVEACRLPAELAPIVCWATRSHPHLYGCAEVSQELGGTEQRGADMRVQGDDGTSFRNPTLDFDAVAAGSRDCAPTQDRPCLRNGRTRGRISYLGILARQEDR